MTRFCGKTEKQCVARLKQGDKLRDWVVALCAREKREGKPCAKIWWDGWGFFSSSEWVSKVVKLKVVVAGSSSNSKKRMLTGPEALKIKLWVRQVVIYTYPQRKLISTVLYTFISRHENSNVHIERSFSLIGCCNLIHLPIASFPQLRVARSSFLLEVFSPCLIFHFTALRKRMRPVLEWGKEGKRRVLSAFWSCPMKTKSKLLARFFSSSLSRAIFSGVAELERERERETLVWSKFLVVLIKFMFFLSRVINITQEENWHEAVHFVFKLRTCAHNVGEMAFTSVELTVPLSRLRLCFAIAYQSTHSILFASHTAFHPNNHLCWVERWSAKMNGAILNGWHITLKRTNKQVRLCPRSTGTHEQAIHFPPFACFFMKIMQK